MNPFSTRRVRPGAIAYLFSEPDGANQLIGRLREHGWRGEIVGPHGSGKSTLLATLVPHLEQAGRKVVCISLRDGQQRLPIASAESCAWDEATQVIIDGYEQLSWWSRRWLDLTCRRRGAGLLVTAHQSVGLPLLYRTSPTLDVLQTIVTGLLPSSGPRLSPDDVARCFDKHSGNARETLFALYDLYESRRVVTTLKSVTDSNKID